MSKADEIFINMCKQVLESGYDTMKNEPRYPANLFTGGIGSI